MTAEVPLRDVGGVRASTGGYPWRLDGDYQSNMVITNVGSVPARYTARIQIGSMNYSLGIKKLAVGASASFDIRQLRDSQTPDTHGNRLPADALQGQFYWSTLDTGPAVHFSGRAELISVAEHVSSSFSCMMCCPESVVDGRLSLSSSQVEVDETITLYPEIEIADCYESRHWELAQPDGFGGYNSSVVSVDAETVEARDAIVRLTQHRIDYIAAEAKNALARFRVR